MSGFVIFVLLMIGLWVIYKRLGPRRMSKAEYWRFSHDIEAWLKKRTEGDDKDGP